MRRRKDVQHFKFSYLLMKKKIKNVQRNGNFLGRIYWASNQKMLLLIKCMSIDTSEAISIILAMGKPKSNRANLISWQFFGFR